ncbi:hypothetical protein BU26DRAFT_565929 [Trematosphaeria pertusa]|uniref:Uncharacterized protein n=1 Tax=Trematosphaeria pertusa TaxID=390896 RepID=A0A6A6ID90_9PLEO|nr:uncharacterized protein BU26DRAFT_565929 [Trematosphaeria pertusa]KAF2248544.1 hypothetical protein BU26DRAFT_565929 [Trematosphaeria pertusa]
MPSVDDVPNEIWLEIFDQLSHSIEHRTGTFAALCLTSRRFRELAEPLLYESYGNLRSRDLPHSFPLAILERPHLAKHVRNLDLYLGGGVGDQWDINPMPEDLYRRLRRSIQQSGFCSELIGDWTDALARLGRPRGRACAALGLLLASEKLEVLSVRYHQKTTTELWREGSRWNKESFLLRIMRDTLLSHTNKLGRFHSIRSVVIARPGSNTSFPLYPLAFLLKIPSLLYLQLRGCVDQEMGLGLRWDVDGPFKVDGDWHLVEKARLQTLVFRESDVSHEALHLLMSRCSALKHFYLDMHAIDPGRATFDFGVLDTALRYHRHALESLYLRFYDNMGRGRWGWGLNSPRSGSLSSLSQFNKLKSARVPGNVLLPYNWISPSSITIPSLMAEVKKVLPLNAQAACFSGCDVVFGDKYISPYADARIRDGRVPAP